MQVSLTPAADHLVLQLLELGYDDPAQVIEIALQRLAQAEASQDSPDYVAWIQAECALALEQIEQDQTIAYDLEQIKLKAHQNLLVD